MCIFFFKFSCINWNVENQGFASSQATADKIVHGIIDNPIQLKSMKNENSGTFWVLAVTRILFVNLLNYTGIGD